MDRRLDILITAAVNEEVAHLVAMIPAVVQQCIGRRTIFFGHVSDRDVGILITGPGMINAAQAMTAALEQIKPELIIHTGCAGVFDSSGLDIGDIGIALSETDIHTGIESKSHVCPAPLPFSLLDTSQGPISGVYPLDHILADKARKCLATAFGKKNVRVVCGPFITVSTITATDHRADALRTAYSPLMESMEGSAAAHVAYHYQIPFLEIRSASNRVGNRDKTLWNLPLAFERCSHAVFHLINLITPAR